MLKTLRFLVLAFALWMGSLPASAWAKGTSAGDPAAAVKDGQSGSDWLAGAKRPNWNVSQKISPGMSQILSQTLIDFSSYTPKGACPAAAANTAWNALADAANAGPLDAFLDAIKSSLSGIKKVATFGADPSAAADMLDAGTLVDKYVDELKSSAKDEGKSKIKDKFEELWKGKPVEVLTRTSARGGCDTTVVAIWDRAASSYEVTVYGNCHCNLVPVWGGGSTVKLKTFAVQLRGSVTPAITDDGVLVLNVGFPQITVSSNCDCDKPDHPTYTAPPPEQGGLLVLPGTGGGTTSPGPKHDDVFMRTIKTDCPACQSIVDKIHAAQEARDGMDIEYRSANDKFNSARSRGDKEGVAAAEAALNALRSRDAGLIELEEALLAELRACEKEKCPPHTGGSGGNCVPPKKRPRAPIKPGSSTHSGLHGRAGSISYDSGTGDGQNVTTDGHSQHDQDAPGNANNSEPWSGQYGSGTPDSAGGSQAWSSGNAGEQWGHENHGGDRPGGYGQDQPNGGGYPVGPPNGSVPLRDKLVSQIQQLGEGNSDVTGDTGDTGAGQNDCDPGAQ
jgi:hypothetical protein